MLDRTHWWFYDGELVRSYCRKESEMFYLYMYEQVHNIRYLVQYFGQTSLSSIHDISSFIVWGLFLKNWWMWNMPSFQITIILISPKKNIPEVLVFVNNLFGKLQLCTPGYITSSFHASHKSWAFNFGVEGLPFYNSSCTSCSSNFI